MVNVGAPWGPPDQLVDEQPPAVQHVYHHEPWLLRTVGKALLIPFIVIGGILAALLAVAILLGALVSRLPGGDAPAAPTTAVTATTAGG